MRCLSVRHVRVINISSKLFHRRVATAFLFTILNVVAMFRGSLLMVASNAGDKQKSQFSDEW